MDHAAGKGHFTVGAKGTRVKRDPDNLYPELDAPTTFVDIWLAGNPGSKEEAAAEGLSLHKTASCLGPGGLFVGFEEEARALAAGIKKYGSLEAYEQATAHNHDYFADVPKVPFKEQFKQTVTVPENVNCFHSHLGSEGVHRIDISGEVNRYKVKPDAPEFVVTPRAVSGMEKRLPDATSHKGKVSDPVVIEVAQPASRLKHPEGALLPRKFGESQTKYLEGSEYKPSKSVNLASDFEFD